MLKFCIVFRLVITKRHSLLLLDLILVKLPFDSSITLFYSLYFRKTISKLFNQTVQEFTN